MKTEILESHTETTGKPFLLVRASDEADAEIFAQDNGADFDEYFEGMTAGMARETTEPQVYRVNFK